MDKYYVTPDIAKVLKEIGFNVPCTKGITSEGFTTDSVWPLPFNSIDSAISLGYTAQPLWVQVLDWAVDEHSIYGFIVPAYLHPKMMYSYLVDQVNYTEIGFDTPEEAYQACVIEIIDIILARKYESESNYSPGLRGQEDCGDNIREQDSQQ